MLTYQDLVAVGDNTVRRMEFVQRIINEHRGSELYKTAVMANQYYKHLNPTIMAVQKFVYDAFGRTQPDIISANHKIPCRYFFYFVTQQVSYLLGNGVTFKSEQTKGKLGSNFDRAVKQLATKAICAGISFGFWNLDHLEVFGVADDNGCFAPLYDEENGSLRAGVRFWQIDGRKPIRATLFEEDGFTEFIKRPGEDMEILQDKRSYVLNARQTEVSGTEIFDGKNWPTLPIIPFFNINKQSDLLGSRGSIDAYDLMASDLVNNVDDANVIYWIIRNAGGMDDIDDAEFIKRLKTMHVAHLENDEQVDPHSIIVPYEASNAALDNLRTQMFDDFMALDVKKIAGGAVTATQIEAAYEPLNEKTDQFEDCVTEFIDSLLQLIGIEDQPTYTRSAIVNKSEEIQNVINAAQFLTEDYVTKKILDLMGDQDQAVQILAEKIANDYPNIDE